MTTVPLIPEPDYNSINKYDRGLHHHYIPSIPKKEITSLPKNLLERYEKLSQLQYNKPIDKERALRIARTQGVPVLPHTDNNETSNSDKIIITNRAMLVHVKNHKNFDNEGHNFESCKNCIICRCTTNINSPSPFQNKNSFNRNQKECIPTNYVLLEDVPQEPGYLSPILLDLSNDTQKKLIFPRSLHKRKDKQTNNFYNDHILNNDIKEQITRKMIVTRSFNASRLDELSVNYGEVVKLITIKDSWCLIENSDNLKGWIPYPESFL
uniref:SH3 domain-containing protein n=1 Tax=Strongyloides venezuelensis TaxID=75913 RepID=A0A0K0FY94_STRVS